MNRSQLLPVLAALAIGAGLFFVMNLEPVWWLAWFLPGLLFAVALRADRWTSHGLVALAALIGASSSFSYLLKVMPLPQAVIVLVLFASSWVLVIGVARRIVLAHESAWTVLALPVVSVALDTLLANLAPDGNFGSLGYTQAEFLPMAQFASLAGIGGILFLVMLCNSALAIALVRGMRWPRAGAMYATTGLAVVLVVSFGLWRLQSTQTGPQVTIGIASIDDFVASPRSEESRDVWTQYQAQVEELAGSGARVVLLPEKIEMLSTQEAQVRKQWLGALARENRVWLVAGLGVQDGTQRRNEAWWFAPDGRLVTNYLKHHLAPPEREFVSGGEFPVNEIDGLRYGVAICKDMHFASLGRGFGRRDARVMLVPAWDFDDDARLAANMTKMRGIESGYSVVRAARDGLLSITDAHGRMLALERSAPMPGTTLFATVAVAARIDTAYSRIGDAFGWSCVVAAPLLLALAFRRRR